MTEQERPYIPFYKPYGMSDEEYEYEVMLAEQRLQEWEQQQEDLYKQSLNKTDKA